MISRFIKWLFRHRHEWVQYMLIGNHNRTIFYCRKCICGLDQIQNVGPMGNGKWVNKKGSNFKPFEQEWLDNAKPYLGN